MDLDRGGKKLIEFGWDVPSPRQARDNVRAMERRPFDGVVLRLPEEVGGGRIFDVAAWAAADPARRADELATLADISWERFTDNFVALYAASNMDWFDDEDWEGVLAHARFCARAARAGRCAGLMWDPEPYGANPWIYTAQAHAGERSFAEYRAVVRRRGGQLMAALSEEFPGFTLLTLRLLGDFADQSYWSGRILGERDPVRRDGLIQRFYYGLHADFLNGMLDPITPDVVIVDGNEDAYYFTSASEFSRGRHLINQEVLPLVAPELRARYRAQVQVGQALYLDYLYGRWDAIASFPLHLVRQARELDESQRDHWLEHNAYHALATADTYAWCYSEGSNWWTGENLPPGAEAALVRARSKQAAGEPLGFAVEPMLEAARARAKARIDAALIGRTATVTRLTAGPAAAVGDAPAGRLEDPGDGFAPLLSFLPMLSSTPPADPIAPTEAGVGYDARNLYVRVRCSEPRIEHLRASGANDLNDDDVVRVVVARGPQVLELVLNAGGIRSTIVHDADRRIEQVAVPWRGTARIETAAWEADFAIPWASLSIEPRPGGRLRVNAARQRVVDTDDKERRELTSWSQVATDVTEPEHLGEWVLV